MNFEEWQRSNRRKSLTVADQKDAWVAAKLDLFNDLNYLINHASDDKNCIACDRLKAHGLLVDLDGV